MWPPTSLPLRVMLVVDALDGGGAERYVSDLATALAGRGHAVTVACSVGSPAAGPLQLAGVEVIELVGTLIKRRASLTFAHQLGRLLRERRPDVVHAHIYASAAAAALATVGTRIPLLVTEHTEAPWRGRRAVWMSRFIYRRADRIHVVTSAIHDLLEARYGVARSFCEHLPPAVTAPAPCRLAAPVHWQGRRLIGRVSRLTPEKGIDVFLHAAAKVAPEHPNAHFIIVGDGPLRRDLERLADRLRLAERVEFLGHRTDARALIARLELLAVSSLSDGAPLVVLEARHARVPVIASAVGGLPDQIRHQHDGLLVPAADPDALGAAIGLLLEQPDAARRLAHNGHRRVSAWTHAQLVERVEATYRRLLAADA